MNAFDRGRITGLPGVESKLTWYPDRVGVRIRNSVVRMLREGFITGGWSSKSRALALQLCDHFELNVLAMSWGAVRLYVPLADDLKAEIIRIVKADFSAFLLENSPSHTKYYQEQNASMIRELEHGRPDWVRFHDLAFAKQACALLNANMTAVDRAKIDDVIAIIENNQPIQFATIRR